MDVELYHEFIVLAEELNFHQAATRLCTTQSTLSKHIAALERHYGVRLFERDRTHVKVTAKGSYLLECAMAIWNEYERSIELIKGDSLSARGLFISGILDDPFALPRVSATLSRLQRARHQSLPHFLPCASTALDDQASLLRSGESDCAVIFLSEDDLGALPDQGEFAWSHVCSVPMDAIVRPAHPLAVHDHLNLRDLFDCTLIRLVGPRITPNWRLIERQLKDAGVIYRTRPFAASFVYDYSHLDPEDAVLLATRPDAHTSAPNGGTTVRIPFADGELSLQLYALYRRDRLKPELTSFIKALCNVYEKAYAPCAETEGDS